MESTEPLRISRDLSKCQQNVPIARKILSLALEWTRGDCLTLPLSGNFGQAQWLQTQG